MRDIESELAKKGAEIVLVGNGAPGFIPPFRERTGFPGKILTDPSRRSFEAAGLNRSVGKFLHPGGALAAARAAVKGYLPGAQVKGDALQLGGVLVVRPDGAVAYQHASRWVGDHPSNDAVLQAVA